MTGTRNTAALIASRRATSKEKRQRVLDAVQRLLSEHEPITFGRVAAAAGVSEGLVHDRELKPIIIAARDAQTVAPAPQPASTRTAHNQSYESLRADTALVRQDNRQLRDENAKLRKRLRAVLADESDPELHLAGARLVAAEERGQRLAQEAVELRRSEAELRRQLTERDEELASLRLAHARLMKRVNHNAAEGRAP